MSDQWSASTSRAWRRAGSGSGTASRIRPESSRRMSSTDLLMRKQGPGAREVAGKAANCGAPGTRGHSEVGRKWGHTPLSVSSTCVSSRPPGSESGVCPHFLCPRYLPAVLVEAFEDVGDELVGGEAGDVAAAVGGAGAGHEPPFLRAARLGRVEGGEGGQGPGRGGEAVVEGRRPYGGLQGDAVGVLRHLRTLDAAGLETLAHGLEGGDGVLLDLAVDVAAARGAEDALEPLAQRRDRRAHR